MRISDWSSDVCSSDLHLRIYILYILCDESRVNDDAICIPLGHRIGIHRDHEALGLLAEFGRLLDFDYIARAEILDGDDMAEHGAIGRNARQTDQLVMIIFALAQRRQRRARDGEEGRSEENTSELQ